MIKWEYKFYVSSPKKVGIRNIPSIENLWDENGYRLAGEKSQKMNKYDNEDDVLNNFTQKGWELISVTPLSFFVDRNDLGQTTELMLTFKKPVE